MSEQIEFLLTDEYVHFSQKVAEIHALRKALKEEFKKKHEEFQANLRSLEEQANEAVRQWEDWKFARTKKKPPEKEN